MRHASAPPPRSPAAATAPTAAVAGVGAAEQQHNATVSVSLCLHFLSLTNIDLAARGLYYVHVAVVEDGQRRRKPPRGMPMASPLSSPAPAAVAAAAATSGGGGRRRSRAGAGGGEASASPVPKSSEEREAAAAAFAARVHPPTGLFTADPVRESTVRGIMADAPHASRLMGPRLDDYDGNFCSRVLLVRFKNEEMQMNEGAYFNFDCPLCPIDDFVCLPVPLRIEFSLFMASLNPPPTTEAGEQLDLNSTDISPDMLIPDEPAFSKLATQTLVIPCLASRLHEYYPVHFEAPNFVQLEIAVHAAVTGLRYDAVDAMVFRSPITTPVPGGPALSSASPASTAAASSAHKLSISSPQSVSVGTPAAAAAAAAAARSEAEDGHAKGEARQVAQRTSASAGSMGAAVMEAWRKLPLFSPKPSSGPLSGATPPHPPDEPAPLSSPARAAPQTQPALPAPAESPRWNKAQGNPLFQDGTATRIEDAVTRGGLPLDVMLRAYYSYVHPLLRVVDELADSLEEITAACMGLKRSDLPASLSGLSALAAVSLGSLPRNARRRLSSTPGGDDSEDGAEGTPRSSLLSFEADEDDPKAAPSRSAGDRPGLTPPTKPKKARRASAVLLQMNRSKLKAKLQLAKTVVDVNALIAGDVQVLCDRCAESWQHWVTQLPQGKGKLRKRMRWRFLQRMRMLWKEFTMVQTFRMQTLTQPQRVLMEHHRRIAENVRQANDMAIAPRLPLLDDHLNHASKKLPLLFVQQYARHQDMVAQQPRQQQQRTQQLQPPVGSDESVAKSIAAATPSSATRGGGTDVSTSGIQAPALTPGMTRAEVLAAAATATPVIRGGRLIYIESDVRRLSALMSGKAQLVAESVLVTRLMLVGATQQGPAAEAAAVIQRWHAPDEYLHSRMTDDDFAPVLLERQRPKLRNRCQKRQPLTDLEHQQQPCSSSSSSSPSASSSSGAKTESGPSAASAAGQQTNSSPKLEGKQWKQGEEVEEEGGKGARAHAEAEAEAEADPESESEPASPWTPEILPGGVWGRQSAAFSPERPRKTDKQTNAQADCSDTRTDAEEAAELRAQLPSVWRTTAKQRRGSTASIHVSDSDSDTDSKNDADADGETDSNESDTKMSGGSDDVAAVDRTAGSEGAPGGGRNGDALDDIAYLQPELVDRHTGWWSTVASGLDAGTQHLVVLVHGFQGTAADMRLIHEFLALLLPGCTFLVSQCNEDRSEDAIENMGMRLAMEVTQFIRRKCPELLSPHVAGSVSFVGHSAGGLVIRAALGHSVFLPLLPKLHTYVSLSSPHLGVLYSSSSLVTTGMRALWKWKQTPCLEELLMEDSDDVTRSYLYQLSLRPGLEYFGRVVLVAAHEDDYVPGHSATIQIAERAETDVQVGPDVISMVANLLSPLDGTRLLRVSIDSVFAQTTVDTLIGRAAHVSYLEKPVIAMQLAFFLFPFLNERPTRDVQPGDDAPRYHATQQADRPSNTRRPKYAQVRRRPKAAVAVESLPVRTPAQQKKDAAIHKAAVMAANSPDFHDEEEDDDGDDVAGEGGESGDTVARTLSTYEMYGLEGAAEDEDAATASAPNDRAQRRRAVEQPHSTDVDNDEGDGVL